jgi:hypothetical protein
MQKCIQDSPSSFLLCGEGPQFLAALPPKNANSGRKKAGNRLFCEGESNAEMHPGLTLIFI